MTTAATFVRLSVALISVINASAALTLPQTRARFGITTPVAATASHQRRAQIRRQRPPRVPRRQPNDQDPTEAFARGAAAEL
ncbi:MAG TPA: hypothetical protein VKF35_10765 [Hyphomicrobiaceae bacterium]|nr:hypothetical protein [Hyphomicrobiaceae bacterium]